MSSPTVSRPEESPDDEPIRMPPAIVAAQAAFERDLPRLLKERPGQWVAYGPDGPILFAATSPALHRECRQLGHREYLTRKVMPYPDTDFIAGF